MASSVKSTGERRVLVLRHCGDNVRLFAEPRPPLETAAFQLLTGGAARDSDVCAKRMQRRTFERALERTKYGLGDRQGA